MGSKEKRYAYKGSLGGFRPTGQLKDKLKLFISDWYLRVIKQFSY
jgi:hypothetical protein